MLGFLLLTADCLAFPFTFPPSLSYHFCLLSGCPDSSLALPLKFYFLAGCECTPITLASRVWVGGLFEASLDDRMRPCLKNRAALLPPTKEKKRNHFSYLKALSWASECSFYIVPCSCSMEAISSNISVRTLVRGCFLACLSVSHSHSRL